MEVPILLSTVLLVAIIFCFWHQKKTGFRYCFNIYEKVAFIIATCVILYVYPTPYLGFLFSVLFFFHSGCIVKTESDERDAIENSESYYNILNVSSDVIENSENVENSEEELEQNIQASPKKPQFTTKEQLKYAQSNVFDDEANNMEIRLWDEGYSTQGLGNQEM